MYKIIQIIIIEIEKNINELFPLEKIDNFTEEILLQIFSLFENDKNNIDFCHPFIKRNLIPGKNLALAGNFNLVNTDELFEKINLFYGSFGNDNYYCL